MNYPCLFAMCQMIDADNGVHHLNAAGAGILPINIRFQRALMPCAYAAPLWERWLSNRTDDERATIATGEESAARGLVYADHPGCPLATELLQFLTDFFLGD